MRELRRALELVDHRELRDAAPALGDLVREAREPFGRHRLVHQHAPGLDELARRVRLDDLAVDDDVGSREPHLGARLLHRLARERAVRAAGAQVVLDSTTVAVPLAPLGLRDRIPDRLSGVALMYTR